MAATDRGDVIEDGRRGGDRHGVVVTEFLTVDNMKHLISQVVANADESDAVGSGVPHDRLLRRMMYEHMQHVAANARGSGGDADEHAHLDAMNHSVLRQVRARLKKERTARDSPPPLHMYPPAPTRRAHGVEDNTPPVAARPPTLPPPRHVPAGSIIAAPRSIDPMMTMAPPPLEPGGGGGTQLSTPHPAITMVGGVEHHAPLAPARVAHVALHSVARSLSAYPGRFEYSLRVDRAPQPPPPPTPVQVNSPVVPGTYGRVRNTCGFVFQGVAYPPYLAGQPDEDEWKRYVQDTVLGDTRYTHLADLSPTAVLDTPDDRGAVHDPTANGVVVSGSLRRATRVRFTRLIVPFARHMAPFTRVDTALGDDVTDIPYVTLAIDGMDNCLEGTAGGAGAGTTRFVMDTKSTARSVPGMETGFLIMRPVSESVAVYTGEVPPQLRISLRRPDGSLLSDARDDFQVRTVRRADTRDPVTGQSHLEIVLSRPSTLQDFRVGDVVRLDRPTLFHVTPTTTGMTTSAGQTVSVAEAFDALKLQVGTTVALGMLRGITALSDSDITAALGDSSSPLAVDVSDIDSALAAFDAQAPARIMAVNLFLGRSQGFVVQDLVPQDGEDDPNHQYTRYTALVVDGGSDSDTTARELDAFASRHAAALGGTVEPVDLSIPIVNVSKQHMLFMDVLSQQQQQPQ